MSESEMLSKKFEALCSPRRIEILAMMSQLDTEAGERIYVTVTTMSRQLRGSLQLTSRHLRILSEAGLLETRQSGKYRLYRIREEGLRPVFLFLKQLELSHYGKIERPRNETS